MIHRMADDANKRKTNPSQQLTSEASGNLLLYQLAFDNSSPANIIFEVSSGKIIAANRAACKLLHYSKKELLTKCKDDIFNINESTFKMSPLTVSS